jgi:hypothetical protein
MDLVAAGRFSHRPAVGMFVCGNHFVRRIISTACTRGALSGQFIPPTAIRREFATVFPFPAVGAALSAGLDQRNVFVERHSALCGSGLECAELPA